ncbi:baculoviral IAP repeat-containing protein 7 isoform X1 [Anas platyrhynchos]|uniref:baculoviral IAP repeat-containing protein 7 isoform X1 n=1 Tax=Anas platyrhynchos TaxID=8839 RepID=UPI000F7CEBB1|nr:baculoviral IAP repeat-containing protein 7 isoform X3 [Anas platyrhynchos]|eukprot:XP_027328798.1 baculoviral IAP repeat-containing protein 7 isoform X3 [Anas platyrhynchos]
MSRGDNEGMADTVPAEASLRTAHFQLFNSSMRDEARRLRTFSQWPDSSPVPALDLAEAGFYFVGPGDHVQCFCCGGILKDWKAGDCPMVEHLKFFPFCEFVYHETAQNQQQLPLQGIFDCVDGQFLSLLQWMDIEEVALPDPPAHPEMGTEEMRLSTFQNWPQSSEMRPEQLARAGYFYTGQGDMVRCYYCNGSVRNWAVGDDPWREHARWNPRCEFLLGSRGREFVNSVQESFASSRPPGHSRDQTEQDSSASQDLLRNWRSLSLPSVDQFSVAHNVLEMGFDPLRVLSLVDNKYVLTGTEYLSESELISDLLQLDWEENSVEESRDAETSRSREEMQSEQQKEPEAVPLSTEEQLRRLQEERTCKVCMDRDVSVVFVPCGHLVACGECALNLRLCPICRAVIRESVRTFMS